MLPKNKFILVLDAGTTGIKAFVFDLELNLICKTYAPISKTKRRPGWVEQDALEILKVSKQLIIQAVKQAGIKPADLLGFGITNQRETIIGWLKSTGEPIYPAIVWEDQRTSDYCNNLSPELKKDIRNKTGLIASPYFSATKIKWLLDEMPGARKSAREGSLLFGTVDTWLLWNLAKGRPFKTDYTNASRTMIFNIKEKKWDIELANKFGIPLRSLPDVKASTAPYGVLNSDILGKCVPIVAICGDQQASLYSAGQIAGTVKMTFGTGIFLMQIVGAGFSLHDSFFTTLTAGVGRMPLYAMEAKVNDCAVRVDAVLSDKSALEALLEQLVDESAIMALKLPVDYREIIIDGGVTANDYLPIILAEKTGKIVTRQKIYDGTALGSALMVKRACGY